MNSIFSILVAAVIFVFALGPVVVAMLRPGSGRVVALFYGAWALVAATWHIGLFSQHRLASYDIRDIESRTSPSGDCAEIIRVMEEARIILDRSDPARLVVTRAAWEQMPSAVRDAAFNCVDRLRPEDDNIQPLVVVQR